jgi:indolepyruvate ferredoxin oxidoreductase beta subunit
VREKAVGMSEETKKTANVMMAGVGGQGVLLASDVMARAALAAGLDVKKSEVHGVAQRGGSVVSHVRFGPQVYSPLCPAGDVDLLLGFERLEALRYAHYLRPGGTVLVNEREIPPIQFARPPRPYPEGIEDFLREKGFDVRPVDAMRLAREAGSHRAANVVMLGGAAGFLEIPEEAWQRALRLSLPERLWEVNEKAFRGGRALVARAEKRRERSPSG